ncbi:MAG: hypothetical protein Q4Q23_07080, partial [Methanobacteriaceae archaeon]|nr:hypothetical protein [Methanobacteriaceae archaeon]
MINSYPPINEGNITFKINDSIINITNVINGEANTTYTLNKYSSGNYTITAIYNSNVYQEVTTTGILIIDKKDSYIVLDDVGESYPSSII